MTARTHVTLQGGHRLTVEEAAALVRAARFYAVVTTERDDAGPARRGARKLREALILAGVKPPRLGD